MQQSLLDICWRCLKITNLLSPQLPLEKCWCCLKNIQVLMPQPPLEMCWHQLKKVPRGCNNQHRKFADVASKIPGCCHHNHCWKSADIALKIPGCLCNNQHWKSADVTFKKTQILQQPLLEMCWCWIPGCCCHDHHFKYDNASLKTHGYSWTAVCCLAAQQLSCFGLTQSPIPSSPDETLSSFTYNQTYVSLEMLICCVWNTQM